MNTTPSPPTRGQLCAAAQALPQELRVVVEGKEQVLRIHASDQALLSWISGKADDEVWALPARPDDLRGRWSTRKIAERLKYSQRTIFRSLKKLKQAALITLDTHHHLESRYLLCPDKIIEVSKGWLAQLQQRAADYAKRVTSAENPFRQPGAGEIGAAAKVQRNTAPPTAEDLAQLGDVDEVPPPVWNSPRMEWVPWALAQADAVIRVRGVPEEWPELRRCRRGAEFYRVVLGWGALKYPHKGAAYWAQHARGYAGRLREIWSGQGEQSAAATLHDLALVLEAHAAGKLRRWSSKGDRWMPGPLVVDEWLRMRPNGWELACEQAEHWQKQQAAAEKAAQLVEEPPELSAPEETDKPRSAWEMLYGRARPEPVTTSPTISAPAGPPPASAEQWEQVVHEIKNWCVGRLRRASVGATWRVTFREAMAEGAWDEARSALVQLQQEVLSRARQAELSPPAAALANL